MRLGVACLAVAALLGLSVPAFAQFSSPTLPVEGGSWSFGISGGGADFLRVDWISGTHFEAPAITVPNAGWSSVWDFPSTAAITGPFGVSGVTFHFLDPITDPVSFYFSAYSGGAWVAARRFDWVGNGAVGQTVLSQAQWNPGTSLATTPEPSSMLLLALGLGAFSVRVKRRKVS